MRAAVLATDALKRSEERRESRNVGNNAAFRRLSSDSLIGQDDAFQQGVDVGSIPTRSTGAVGLFVQTAFIVLVAFACMKGRPVAVEICNRSSLTL